MAIIRDSFLNGWNTAAASASSYTFNFTNTAGNYLVVYVEDLTGDFTTGVTYNGVAMTKLIQGTRNPNVGSLEGYLWGLANPATGSNNVVVTRSVGTVYAGGFVTSYSGVDTAVSPITHRTNQAGDTYSAVNGSTLGSLSGSLTTTVNNSVVVGFGIMDNSVGNITGTGSYISYGTAYSNLGSRPLESNPLLVTPAGVFTGGISGATGDSLLLMAALAPTAAVATPTQGTLLWGFGI